MLVQCLQRETGNEDRHRRAEREGRGEGEASGGVIYLFGRPGEKTPEARDRMVGGRKRKGKSRTSARDAGASRASGLQALGTCIDRELEWPPPATCSPPSRVATQRLSGARWAGTDIPANLDGLGADTVAGDWLVGGLVKYLISISQRLPTLRCRGEVLPREAGFHSIGRCCRRQDYQREYCRLLKVTAKHCSQTTW